MSMPTQVLELPLEHIHPAPDNVRSSLGDDTELDQLAASIADVGLQQPIVVMVDPDLGLGDYRVKVGHRRLEAARRAGQMTIPAIIRDPGEPDQLLVARLVENLHRADLDPLDEARAYHALIKEHGLLQRDVAQRVGRSEGHVSKRLSLLALPRKAQEALTAGRITHATALGITSLAKDKQAIANIDQRITDLEDYADIDDAIATAVSREIRDNQREAKQTKLRDEWKAKGLTVLRDKDYVRSEWRHTQAGEQPTHVWISDYGQVEKFVKADAPRPDAKKPAAKSKKRSKAEEAAEAAREELLARRDQAAENREQICRNFLAEADDGDAAYWLPRWVLYTDDTYVDNQEIADLLDLTLGEGPPYRAAQAAVRDHARSDEGIVRVALARMLLDFERYVHDELLDPSNISPISRLDADFRACIELYYRLLRDHGYEPTDFEERLLAEPAK